MSRYRQANDGDIPFIVSLLSGLYDQHEHLYDIPFDGDSAAKTVENVLKHGVALVGDDCCIGGLIAPWQWNYSHTIAYVVFWKAKTHSGMRIFDCFEKLVDELYGARVICEAQMPGRMLKFYSKRGLKPFGVSVISSRYGQRS